MQTVTTMHQYSKTYTCISKITITLTHECSAVKNMCGSLINTKI